MNEHFPKITSVLRSKNASECTTTWLVPATASPFNTKANRYLFGRANMSSPSRPAETLTLACREKLPFVSHPPNEILRIEILRTQIFVSWGKNGFRAEINSLGAAKTLSGPTKPSSELTKNLSEQKDIVSRLSVIVDQKSGKNQVGYCYKSGIAIAEVLLIAKHGRRRSCGDALCVLGCDAMDIVRCRARGACACMGGKFCFFSR